MTIEAFFDELKEKDIICWGSGKHFRYRTYPFLRNSGLLENLRGFVDLGGKEMSLAGKLYARIRKKDLASYPAEKTVLLISAVGYKEILSQIQAEPGLKNLNVIPSIFAESLYEDLQMLTAPKPPINYRKHDHQVIPKVIHSIWFSENKSGLPERYQKCLDSWKKYAPDMEIKIWDLNSYKPEKCIFYDQAVAMKSWAFASDYARADILRRYGGVYMDLDVEMLRPIDDLLYNDAYMSFESLDRVECGSGMGAQKGNQILDEICRSYEDRTFIKSDGSLDMSTCPVQYTKVIEKHGLIKNGGFQFVDDLTIYPFEVLTGKSFDTGIIYTTELSYTLHHHHGSWVPGLAKHAMETRYREIAAFLDNRKEALGKS